MFSATFLGHQGWLLATRRTAILIDPLLGDRFGHFGHLGVRHPPCVVRPQHFPPIDAVLLTHEHDDHLDVPSLALVDRSVPVFMSTRSSAAAHEAVEQLGFDVDALAAASEFEIGDLVVRTGLGDLSNRPDCDEWDVVPMAVWDHAKHGSFASAVDAPHGDHTWERFVDVPAGLLAHANNFTDSSTQLLGIASSAPLASETLAAAVERRLADHSRHCGLPLTTAIIGGGWRFDGTRAWMNERVFPIDNATLAAALAALTPDVPIVAPDPGHTFSMANGRLASSRSNPTVSHAALESRPAARLHRPARPVDDWLVAHGPASGVRSFPSSRLAGLLPALDEFAAHLYGSRVFRELHSIGPHLGEYRSVLCFELLSDPQATITIGYRPNSASFALVAHADATSTYASGIRMWASDLEAFLSGELPASALCYCGRLQSWNHHPHALRFSPHELWMFGHPLRRPRAAQRMYSRLVVDARHIEPAIVGRRR